MISEKYPDFIIIYDDISKKYIVKYTEVKEDKGSKRFERREKQISRELFEAIAIQLIGN